MHRDANLVYSSTIYLRYTACVKSFPLSFYSHVSQLSRCVWYIIHLILPTEYRNRTTVYMHTITNSGTLWPIDKGILMIYQHPFIIIYLVHFCLLPIRNRSFFRRTGRRETRKKSFCYFIINYTAMTSYLMTPKWTNIV